MNKLFFFILLFSSICFAETIEIIEVKHKNPKELMSVLKEFSSEGLIIQPAGQSVIVKGSDKEIANIRKVVEALDVPQTQFTIYLTNQSMEVGAISTQNQMQMISVLDGESAVITDGLVA